MADHDPYAALRLPNFRRYFLGNLMAAVGLHMQSTAVGWDIYERTGSAWSLGLTGLVQFLPVVPLFLVAGHAADRYSRRVIVMLAQLLVAIAAVGLSWVAWRRADEHLIYGFLLLVGVARTFLQPSKASLLPLLVPPDQFTNAVTWSSSAFHMASVLGPALAGVMIAATGSVVAVYLFDAVVALVFVGFLFFVHTVVDAPRSSATSLKDLGAGFSFVWNHPVILGALSLDMFAVLLGGAVTLLPIYSEEILHVGPEGLGWLRAAPAVGAVVMGMLLAHRPPIRRTGRALLAAVIGFGVATIVFGLTKSYPVALVMLFLTGAFDNISVVIRHTLVQTLTPNELRGRVSAVNSLFIGASNELGGFESGMVAGWFGPIVSVVSGGVGTVLVVLWLGWWLPPLRRHGQLVESAAKP
jgi:MFS family permease